MKANLTNTSILLPTFGRADDSTGDLGISPAAKILLPGNQDEVYFTLQGYFLLPDHPIITPTRRFIVIIPENDFDESELARRIWQLAEPGGVNIMLLSLSRLYKKDAYLRRRLAMLAAITEDKQVHVELKVAEEKTWVHAIRKIRKASDLLVCLDGYAPPIYRLSRKNLSNDLASSSGIPVFVLSGLKLGWHKFYLDLFREIAAWLSAIALMVSVFWLQVRLGELLSGSIYTFVMILIVLLEFAVLYFLNLLIG